MSQRIILQDTTNPKLKTTLPYNITYGSTVPLNTVGANGDVFYLNDINSTNVKYKKINGVWRNTALVEEEYYSSSEAFTTTTSTAWQTRIAYAVDLKVGYYKLDWNYSWYYTSTSRAFKCQILANTTNLHSHVEIPRSASTTNRIPSSGFCPVTISTAGTYTFYMQYASSTASDTAAIGLCRINIRRTV